jgi:inner membrane protein
MDNITHTLIGASLASTGLRRRSRYAAAALMIGANIPDLDVIAVPLGHSVEWRRGITHGLPALIVWPFVLTGLILLYHRVRRRAAPESAAGATSPGGAEAPLEVRPRQLVLLSAIAVLTHPVYDWMNSYGMRWLMPLDGTWFHGDSLFIVDPYLMAMLAIGVFLVRRRRRKGASRPFLPGRVVVALGAAYTLALMGLHQVAEGRAERLLSAGDAGAPLRIMAAPTPANPLRWEIVADRGSHYERALLHLARASLSERESIPVGLDDPRASRAARDARAEGFLDWARWPVYRVDRDTVHIIDIRYASPDSRGSWASIPLPGR